MFSKPKRLLAAALALLLALGAPLTALAAEDGVGSGADLLAITVPEYTPGPNTGDLSQIKAGRIYTLLVLPASVAANGSTAKELNVQLLASQALYMGFAVADADGHVTFTDIRLRTAEAAVFYVTGPGVETPLVETTGLSVAVSGQLYRNGKLPVANATVSLMDKTTHYAYANSVQSLDGGSFYLDQLSPGEYYIHVEKPGYLPFTSPSFYSIGDDSTHIIPTPFDLSACLGDVNNDAVRDLTDLTSLLAWYELPVDSVPAGLTPDLSEDGLINLSDVELYLTAADELPQGVGSSADAQKASLSARDTAAGQTDRSLVFSLDHGGVSGLTFTAAHFSLTFRSDYVQPLNQNGGVISTANPYTAAGCLIARSGVTVADAAWQVNGDLTTLSFSLFCQTPTALTDLATFHYRPAPGKTTDDFFQGVFTLPHVAAQVGKASVLTDCALEYPNSAPLALDTITIDPLTSPITIPSTGHTLTLALSATGKQGETSYPNLSGLTWTLSGNTRGVSVADQLLTVTHEAVAGDLTLTAQRDDVTSAPLTLTLQTAPSQPQSVVIKYDNTQSDHLALSGSAGRANTFSFSATVLDQYNAPMDGESVTWSLSGVPGQITVADDGAVTAAADLPAGTHTFSLLASLGDLRAAVNITLTLETVLDHLVLSGPTAAQIPSGSNDLTLPYTLSAVDSMGFVIPNADLNLAFTVTGPDAGDDTALAGVSANADPLTGALTVVVSPSARPGDYTLRVSDGSLSAPDFTLTLQPAQEESTALPVRAAITNQDEIISSKQTTLLYQGGGSSNDLANLEFSAVLLDGDGNIIRSDGQLWHLTVPDLDESTGLGYDIGTDSGKYYLKVNVNSAKSGTFFFTVSATERTSGLSVSIPVELTLLPDIGQVTLNAPKSLTIPASGSLSIPIALTCEDANGNVIAPPGPVMWSASNVAGVTVEGGVLTISSAAKPGEISVSATCFTPDSYVGGEVQLAQGRCTIELVSTGAEKVLALRRDGDLLTGGVDTAYGKEGSALSLTYTPVLRDPATGAVEVLKEGVTWLGLPGTFTVDAKAEAGTYTAPITALYEGRSVSLTAQITLYPDITNLYVNFDEGDADSIANRYSFAVPSRAPKTYYGTVMAQVKSGKSTRQVPLRELALADYDIDIYSPMTGIYTAYDKETGRLALTIEPVASSNSMADPTPSEPEIRYLGIDFDYYPGQDPLELRQTFLLTREAATPTTVLLRQGHGTGSKFVFETARGEATLQTAPGVLADCFALELIDQYGDPVTNQYVSWASLNSPYITLVDPGKTVADAYPRYQSIRRLRIAPNTPEGEYELTISASCGPTADAAVKNPTFTRTMTVKLTVSGQQSLSNIALTGPSMAVIPKWLVRYNSSATNDEVRELAYVAVATDPNGNEIDDTLCDFSWSVEDASGNTPAGVSIKPNTDNTATATVSVNRFARPTTTTVTDGSKVEKPVRVVVTATPKDGGDSCRSEALLTLSRGNLVPTLMTVNGPTQYKMELTDPTVTNTYTFSLVNQYNDPVSDRDAKSVTWTWNKSSVPSYVTLTNTTDSKGYPAVRMTIRNPGKDIRSSITLTASIEFTEASTTSGKATVFQSRPITITVGNPPTGGGSLGGGDLLPEEVPVTASTVTPSTNKSGTTGTATLTKEETDTLTNTTATGTLTITPKNTAGLTSITITFPASVAKSISQRNPAQSLRLRTDIGTLTLSKDALATLGRGSGNISITILNQNNTLGITFRSGGSELKEVSGSMSFQAPVKGDAVTAVQGSNNSDILQKASINNGTLSVAITGTVTMTLGTKGKVFSDTKNHWAKEAVEFVTARNLFNGTSETTFSPNGDMTRSMVVTVLHRLENTPKPTTANLFRDVPSGTWYTDAVVWANAQSIVEGTGDGFHPDDPVTREQLATILYRYMTQQGRDTTKRSSLSAFSDSANVSSWAREAMEWAVATGLINGKSGGILDPRGNASRAEVATMLKRLILTLTPAS